MDTIAFIATKTILINKRTDTLKDILLKISEWIQIIIDYSELLDNDLLFSIFDLDTSLFTNEMRLASLGNEYYNWCIKAHDLHRKGERYKYEKLILISNTGIVEWYCKKFNITNENYNKIINNDNIRLLGAFYHRLKIIIENIRNIFEFFNGKYIYTYFKLDTLNNLLKKSKNKEIYDLCLKIKNYYDNQENLINKYINLEKAVELSQIAIFNSIIKYV
jgi:hypothetical protein